MDGIVFDSSGLSVSLLSQKEASHFGTKLKFAQLLEVGPRVPLMLSVPPGRDNEKVTSVCPRDCFNHILESDNITKLSILAADPHAHLAATSMYGEVLHSQKRSTTFATISDYPEFKRN